MTEERAGWDRQRLLGLLSTPLPVVEPPAPPRIGKYRIVRELARGAMGVVYEGEDLELKRVVAVKLLRESADAREGARARFRREAEAAARLSHPNVVRVYDAGEDAGRMYMVMELVDGRPLSEILGGRSTDLPTLLALLEKAARGASAAHDQGIVHRDLKPANILVTAAGEPKVGDFGLAHWMDSDSALTRSGTPLGTPMYMSPEQVMGQSDAVTPATDVYALGAILYEMATGRPPHAGETTMGLYARIIQDDPTPPRRLGIRVDPDLETICMKALEKLPGQRYPTAREFAEDLRRHRQGEAILATPPGARRRLQKWVRRHRVTSAVVVMAFAAFAGLLSLLLYKAADRRSSVDGFVAKARGILDQRRAKLQEVARLQLLEAQLQGTVGAFDEETKKRPIWKAQQDIAAGQEAAAADRAEAVATLQSALGLDPACAAAKRELASVYIAAFDEAERERDGAAMASNRRMVELYGSPEEIALVRRGGTFSIDSIPAGATAEIGRYREGPDRRLMPTSLGAPSPCPRTFEVEPGSYLVILRRAGFRDVRYPVVVERGQAVTARVQLYTDDEIGPDFVYVPGGRFVLGGDKLAGDPPPGRREVDVADFFIARTELTFDAYAGFVNDLVAQGRIEEATARIPSLEPAFGLRLGPDGRMTCDNPAVPALPVVGVSWPDAVAYAEWRSAREHATYRLPTQLEWEKAARGVDGRCFPWGDFFDWSFAASYDLANGRSMLVPAGGHPLDESPYGVLGMAGNVCEWCTGSEIRNQPSRGGFSSLLIVMNYRAAFAMYVTPEARGPERGFRLVKIPDRTH